MSHIIYVDLISFKHASNVEIATNYHKIILQFVVLSIALARMDTIMFIVREITQIKKKGIKIYNFRIKSGMCNQKDY
jgi:hypothetical protein